MENIKDMIFNKVIPESYLNSFIGDMDGYRKRRDIIENMGYSLLALNWIIPLSKWIGNRKCLEVMAGCGSLTYALQQQNVDIIATDNYTWENHWKDNNGMWTDVENLDAIETVKKYGSDIDIIIMSWPYMDDTGTQVLKTMREVNPECIMIYIGEGSGGCTADDEFFDIVEHVDNKSFDDAVKEYKQWWGIHDRPYLVK